VSDTLPSNTNVLEFPYTRTTGPILGPFLTALRDGSILGNRIGDKVYCPPLEFDPDTFASAEPDMVPVGPGGEVVTATWVAHPSGKHPFDDPFAMALIKLDGADTPLVHAVKASAADAVVKGTRVTAQFRDEREGAITDVYFVPEADAVDQDLAVDPAAEPVKITTHPIALTIDDPYFPHKIRFAEALLEGRIVGQRSPASGKVYVPSRGYDPMERVRMSEADDVEVADTGTVISFTQLAPIQYHGQTETEPFIRCSVILDGADSPLGGIDIKHIPVEEFRVGMRLQAVWRPAGERKIDELDNRFGSLPAGVIERWDHTGEPDVATADLPKGTF
jgi:uncharacterized OB-fold protein